MILKDSKVYYAGSNFGSYSEAAHVAYRLGYTLMMYDDKFYYLYSNDNHLWCLIIGNIEDYFEGGLDD